MAKKMLQLPRSAARQRQGGVVLIVALLFLIMLTMIGTAAVNMSTAEERMARSNRDYNVALQAAETALRDAQADVLNTGPWAQPVKRISGQSGFNDQCTLGMCRVQVGAGNRVWEKASGAWLTNLTGLDKARMVGTHTGNYRMATTKYPDEAITAQAQDTNNVIAPVPAPPSLKVGGVTRQPRYLLEVMPDDRPGQRISAQALGGYNTGLEFVYRVTSIGYGSDANTRVMLQMMYKP
jgi:type IV pilus assembly protein PilX